MAIAKEVPRGKYTIQYRVTRMDKGIEGTNIDTSAKEMWRWWTEEWKLRS